MATRQYRSRVELPAHLTTEDLGKVGLFICDRGALDHGHTILTLVDGEISGWTFADAWAKVEPGDRVDQIKSTMGNADSLSVRIECFYSIRHVEVEGPHELAVLGLATAVRQFIEKNFAKPPDQPLAPATVAAAHDLETAVNTLERAVEQAPAARRSRMRSWGRRAAEWWRRKGDDVKVEVIGGLILVIVLALAAKAWIW